MKLLIKYGLIIFFIPFISIISLMFVEDLNTQLIIAIVGMILTAISILYGKKKVSSFIKPSDEILQRMEIEPIPVEYNPDKFKISSKIFGYLIYLNILSNLFGYLAYKFSITVQQPTGENALIISDGYLLWSIVFIMIGVVSFALWAKLKQAYCICSEKDDTRRSMLNSFAINIQENAQKLNLYYQLAKMSNKL